MLEPTVNMIAQCCCSLQVWTIADGVPGFPTETPGAVCHRLGVGPMQPKGQSWDYGIGVSVYIQPRIQVALKKKMTFNQFKLSLNKYNHTERA